MERQSPERHRRPAWPSSFKRTSVLIATLVSLCASSTVVCLPYAHAQGAPVVEDGPASISYVPAPEPPPQKRKKLKQKNAEKPLYRRPWAMNDSRRDRWKGIGLGTAGLVVGFLAHEMGHILMNFAYGIVPNFEGLRYAGIIPFFRISSGVSCNDQGCLRNGEEFKGGRTGAYLITSAGFNVQHLINEILISLDPNLQHHRSPFQKGILFFNLSLSVGYALSTWFQVRPPVGDIEGMANAAQIKPEWVALMVMIPTGLDIYRFFLPDSKWAPWVSRSSKVLFLGASFIW